MPFVHYLSWLIKFIINLSYYWVFEKTLRPSNCHHMFLDIVTRTSRNGRQRDNHPAGHRIRGRRTRPGIYVYGRGRRSGGQNGRICGGVRSAGHRPGAGSQAALENDHCPAATPPTGSAPPVGCSPHSGCSFAAGPQPSVGSAPSAGSDYPLSFRVRPDSTASPAATQNHGHPNALAVGPELKATMCGAQTLGSQGRRPRPGGDAHACTQSGTAVHFDHDPG